VLLGEDNSNAEALILYARCLAERGELGEAQVVLDAVKSDEHKAALAGAKAQLTFLRQAASLPEAAELKSRLAQNPQDDEAAISWHPATGAPAVRGGAGRVAEAVPA
jgi:putative thioredoxin